MEQHQTFGSTVHGSVCVLLSELTAVRLLTFPLPTLLFYDERRFKQLFISLITPAFSYHFNYLFTHIFSPSHGALFVPYIYVHPPAQILSLSHFPTNFTHRRAAISHPPTTTPNKYRNKLLSGYYTPDNCYLD